MTRPPRTDYEGPIGFGRAAQGEKPRRAVHGRRCRRSSKLDPPQERLGEAHGGGRRLGEEEPGLVDLDFHDLEPGRGLDPVDARVERGHRERRQAARATARISSGGAGVSTVPPRRGCTRNSPAAGRLSTAWVISVSMKIERPLAPGLDLLDEGLDQDRPADGAGRRARPPPRPWWRRSRAACRARRPRSPASPRPGASRARPSPPRAPRGARPPG